MANDPLQNVSPNEPLELQARTVNLWNEVARAYRATKNNGGAGRVDKRPHLPSLHVLVRNDTDDALPERSVLRVPDWVVSPVTYPLEVADNPVVTGLTPNASTNLVVILLEAIPKDQFGYAVNQGLAVVDVLVNDASHTFANPISGDNTKLGSATSGVARILKWETSGTTRRAIVVLGDGQGAASTELTGFIFKSDTGNTAASRPDAPYFKWNNATQNASTFLYFSNLTIDNYLVDTFWSSMGSTGCGGTVYLQQANDRTKWQKFRINTVSGFAGLAGWMTFGVTHLASSLNPIDDDVNVLTEWTIIADAGAGSSGAVNLVDMQQMGTGRKVFPIGVVIPGQTTYPHTTAGGALATYGTHAGVTGPTIGMSVRGAVNEVSALILCSDTTPASACLLTMLNATTGATHTGPSGQIRFSITDTLGLPHYGQTGIGGGGDGYHGGICTSIGSGPTDISNVTSGILPIANGGTGASTASGARSNLGIGTIGTQDANNVSITGGSITGITDLAIADGGTGASTAAGARTNLGLGTAAVENVSFFLQVSNNLSDLADAATARTNLGLGSAATNATSDFLQVTNNLSDLANPATARTNLGLGTAAVEPVATFAQAANNLSDLASAGTARSNLGLGTLATQNAAADSGALTDGTGGSADASLVAIAGSGNDTDINNNFADLAALYTAMRSALQAAGIMS